MFVGPVPILAPFVRLHEWHKTFQGRRTTQRWGEGALRQAQGELRAGAGGAVLYAGGDNVGK